MEEGRRIAIEWGGEGKQEHAWIGRWVRGEEGGD